MYKKLDEKKIGKNLSKYNETKKRKRETEKLFNVFKDIKYIVFLIYLQIIALVIITLRQLVSDSFFFFINLRQFAAEYTKRAYNHYYYYLYYRGIT